MIGAEPGAIAARLSAARPLLVATAAVLIFTLTAVIGVAAQADLVSADPAPGSTVSGSPATIQLSFSQALRSGSRLDLYTGQFQSISGVTTQLAGSELRGVLGQPLAPATYTVQWTAVTEDGVSTQGSYQFAVAAPAVSPFGGELTAVVAAAATIVTAAVTIFVLVLNRRQRL